MEDHLLEIFGGHDKKKILITEQLNDINWSPESLQELHKIPGFVRGKVKRNTEKYAKQNNLNQITLEVLYQAKEAVGT